MKFKIVVLCAALLAMGAGAANAASNWVGVVGGAGVPTGDYGDAATTGWQLGATGTHMLNEKWGVGADVGYHAWNGSSDANSAAEAAFGAGSEWKWSAIQATAQATYALPAKGSLASYLKGGLGFYGVTGKLNSPSGDVTDTQNKLGYNIGAGMNFASSGSTRWGLVGQYHIVPIDNQNVDFMTFGINMMWGVGE